MRLIVLLLLLMLAAPGDTSAQKQPRLDLSTLQGEPLDQEQLAGKVLVLDFWATWCGPCRVTLPRFQELYEAYAGREGVAFLLINPGMNDTAGDAREYLQANELVMPAYWDERGWVARQFGIRALPTTIVLDQSGELVLWQEGATSAARYEHALRSVIDAALAEESGRG